MPFFPKIIANRKFCKQRILTNKKNLEGYILAENPMQSVKEYDIPDGIKAGKEKNEYIYMK